MKVTRGTRFLLSTFAILWIAAGISFFSVSPAQAAETQEDFYRNIRLFNEVFFRINQNYVEDVSSDSLVHDAIKGMLDSLDPHTTYFEPDDFDEFNASTKGEFGGLGITINKIGDYITVEWPMEGTPAYQAGIMPGDKISKVDGESIKGASTKEAIRRMRGPKGSKVHISIIRPGVEHELEYEIIRDVIKIKSIPYAFKLDDGVGYIRIRQFNANTTEEFRAALDELEQEGIKGLMIDLRDNPGGLLDEAINVVNEFIGPNKLAVFTKGRNPRASQEYYTRYNRMRSGYPVVALINQNSASASEIFSGSLQDWDKGLIVGMPSFGKGSVQQLFPLNDTSGIKITTSKYYIHSGRCIHKDINDRILRGETVTEADRKKAEEDARKEVYKTEKGRTVYGGGGITPDIEYEQDLLNAFEIDLLRKNVLFDYAVDYMVDNTDAVTKDFVVSDDICRDFMTFAKKQGITYTSAQLDSSKAWIKTRLKAEVFAKKFGDVESYKVRLQSDNQFAQAAKLFDDYATLDEMFAAAPSLGKDALAKLEDAKEERKQEALTLAQKRVQVLDDLIATTENLPEGKDKVDQLKVLQDLRVYGQRSLENLEKRLDIADAK